MVLNYIWIAFFLVAFVVALVRLIFFGDFDVFPAMMDSTFSSSKTAFEISLGLTGVLSLWLGIMKIGEKGGLVNLLARLLSPVFVRLFPDIPKGHPVTAAVREHDGRAERREFVLEEVHRVLPEVEPRRVVECEVSVHFSFPFC